MTQFRISTFNRVGLALISQRQMVAPSIGQAVIQGKLIAVILLSWGLLNHLLGCLRGALPDWLDSQKAACFSVDNGHDVDFVFFSPMQVKSSSCSATSTGLSGPGSVWGKPSAYSLSQLATD